MSKAYSYIRFSTPEQAKGRSALRQQEKCEAFCLANGLELAKGDDYTFLDTGKSAYKGEHIGENGQLSRFLALVKDGSIAAGSYLVVESLDRLSRASVHVALMQFMQLLEQGINIATLTDQRIYKKGVGTEDLIISIFVMSRANEESNTKAQRVGDAWRKKQELARTENKPMGNARPLWLDLEDGRYAANEERANIVRRVFQMAIDGYGKRVIAKTLNGDGIASFKGKTWGSSSVQKLLSNKSVFGEYQPYTGRGKERQPRGDAIQDHYPAILDQSTFYQAQEATTGRRVAGATKQSERFNVWQGIAHCGLETATTSYIGADGVTLHEGCSAPMHLVNKGKPPKGGTYLHCYQARKGLCKAKAVRLDQSELMFKEVLAKVNSLSLVQSNSASIQKQLSEVEGRLAEQISFLPQHKASLKVRPNSQTILALLDECEAAITALVTEKEAILVALAADTITHKDEFFSKLDLESREGRYRANALLKRLKIKVFITVDNSDTRYLVIQDGEPIIGLVMLDGELRTFPLTLDQLHKANQQDGDGSVEAFVLRNFLYAKFFIPDIIKDDQAIVTELVRQWDAAQ